MTQFFSRWLFTYDGMLIVACMRFFPDLAALAALKMLESAYSSFSATLPCPPTAPRYDFWTHLGASAIAPVPQL
jgi:hypothetical protein